jgi:hypothetical protein
MTASPRSVVSSAVAFVGSHALACLRGLWLPSALILAAFLLIGRPVACLATGQCGANDSHGLSPRFGLLAWLALFFIVVLPLRAAMQASVWRLVLRPTSTPTGPLRFGADERRLLALAILQGAIAIATASVVFLATGGLLLLVRRVFGQGSIALAAVLLLAVPLLSTAYVATRLRLAGPATIRLGTVRLRDVWRSTRRRVAWLRRADVASTIPGVVALGVSLLVVAVTLVAAPHALPDLADVFALPADRLCVALWKALGPWLVALLFVGYALVLAVSAVFLAGRAFEYVALDASTSDGGTP